MKYSSLVSLALFFSIPLQAMEEKNNISKFSTIEELLGLELANSCTVQPLEDFFAPEALTTAMNTADSMEKSIAQGDTIIGKWRAAPNTIGILSDLERVTDELRTKSNLLESFSKSCETQTANLIESGAFQRLNKTLTAVKGSLRFDPIAVIPNELDHPVQRFLTTISTLKLPNH